MSGRLSSPRGWGRERDSRAGYQRAFSLAAAALWVAACGSGDTPRPGPEGGPLAGSGGESGSAGAAGSAGSGTAGDGVAASAGDLGTGGVSAGSGGTAGSSGESTAGLGGMPMTGPVPDLTVGGGILRLEVCAEDVIRVAFAESAAFFTRESLAAAPKRCEATPWELVEEAGQRTLRTTRLELRVDVDTGRIAFHDRSGNPIVAEKTGGGRTLTAATVQGEATNNVRQEWDPNDGEALYGLGNYQHGVLDIKGYDVELSQYNTNAVVPALVSSRGYGIFWDNTSYTRFGDLRPYERVPGVTYDAAGMVSGAASGSVDYQGNFTPETSGDYLFETYSSGTVRLTVDGEPVIDHYRQGWLPDTDVARVRLSAGQSVPIRLTWSSDIDVNIISFSVKAPPAAEPPTSLWSEVGDGIDYWFFYGPEIDRVIAGYRRVTGEASLMPRWAFGFWQSRERYASAAELTAAAAGFRSRDLPIDVIVQDWQYWPENQWGSHEFDATRFANPQSFITTLHDTHHVKLLISVWPKFYTSTANYRALQAGGFAYPDNGIADFLDNEFVYYDAFDQGARELYWEQLNEQLFSLGVDAWWLDGTEPEVQEGPFESPSAAREAYQANMHPTALGSGSRMLNAYSLVNSQAVYEGQRAAAPDQRVVILTRSAFAGQQRYASATWSGDITSTWSALKKQIPGGLGFSISGIPYWTVDSGGFAVPPRFANGMNAAEWRELNTRWFEWATFLPILRVHGQAPPREPWQFGGDASPAFLAMQKFDRLRYRLLPYVYSLAGAVTHRAFTMLRPLVMDFRGDPSALGVGDQYLFGPALMVSPVTTYQATSRSVYLPATPGGWYDFWTGETEAGGARIDAPAPFDSIPVHVRAGSIVPFGPELAYANERPADPVTLYVYTGADGGFELYEDDGTSYGYETGAFSRIPIRYDEAGRTLTIGAREGSFPGMLAERTFDVVFVGPDKAAGFSFMPMADQSLAYSGAAVTVPVTAP